MPARETRRRSIAHPIALIAAALLPAGCGDASPAAPHAPPGDPADAAPTLPAATSAVPSGHERMVALLRSIADRTDADNPWLGDALARKLRQELAELPADATPGQRLKLLVSLGSAESRLGQEQAAIDRYTEAQALVTQLGSAVPQETIVEVAMRLGVACIRMGETQNCCRAPNADSCILPVRDGGRHTVPLGSQQAMEHFRRVLELVPPDSADGYRARWLLNIAAMTIGQWPDGLSASELIPQSAYDSGVVIPHFENVAGELGVGTFNLAGGAVVDDLDGDGTLDILTSTSDTRGPMRLLHGDGHGGFQDHTQQAGLDVEFGGLNLVDADYDNDGDLDVFVLRGGWYNAAGRHPHSLLQNDGAGRFTDVTFDAGMGEVLFATQAGAWSDYDGDGDLDLYVGSEMTPEVPVPNQLFRNEGDGTFTDVARQAGVENGKYTKAVCWGDYDGDRRPDLYVSNMGSPNRLYHNDGDGTFSDVAPKLGVSGPLYSFAAWFFDYDNDGVLDLYVTSYRGSHPELARVAADALGQRLDDAELPRLYRGDGHGGFRDVAAECGLQHIVGPMGANFGDLDLDGWLDIYLGTGYPDYDALMPNVMYLSQPGPAVRRFANVSWAGGFGHLQKGHAIAFADLDGDGDTDVFEQTGGAIQGDRFYNALYRNPGWHGHWLTVQLVGHRSNRCAIGARLRADIVEDGQPRSIYRHVNTGATFGCNPLRQTLGLGKAERVERLEVSWPTTGLVQVLTDLPVDRSIRVVEDADGFEATDG